MDIQSYKKQLLKLETEFSDRTKREVGHGRQHFSDVAGDAGDASVADETGSEDFAEAQSPRDRRAAAKIAVVQQECQRLQSLLDNFLHFAKVRTVRFEASDLNAEVRRVLEFFAPKTSEAGIELISYLDPDLPSVVLDRESFHGALINLVLNAQQAMPRGGQLVVRTGTTAAGVALELIDTGVGMDKKTASQVFDAFFSTKPGGSGLGLPTTRKVVETHGGRISVQSEVGRGTKFTIDLPLPPRLTSVRPANP